MKLIFPISKSPHLEGRIGSLESQDWRRALVHAVSLLEEGDKILIMSEFRAQGSESEVDIYVAALHSLGVTSDQIMIDKVGNETVGQIQNAKNISEGIGVKMVVVSTWTHHLRVRWISWREEFNAKHLSVFGIPRPREFVTDAFATLLYPLIDMCGGSGWWVTQTDKRRSRGKL